MCTMGLPKQALDLAHFGSLRVGREQHVADSSSHALYLMKTS